MNSKSPTIVLHSEVNSPILKDSRSTSNDLKSVPTNIFNENVELLSPQSLSAFSKKSAEKKTKKY